MDAVKAFNSELSSLYDVKPPISKAKMNSLTRGAIKAIKFYKHVVQSVEKFIQKCKPEYKVPGLYVIDSIVRQSRHQFGTEKDVFAPRFAKNMQTTFLNLLKCPPEDKSKVIRVLNLWQKNAVFPPEVIQPLFDLVDPNHPIHKEQSNGVMNSGNNNQSAAKASPTTAKNTPKDQKLFTTAKPIDPAWLAQTKMETANIVNANKLLHLQQLLLKKQEAANEATQSSVKFDKKLLDFDYGEEEDDDVQVATSPKMSQAAISQHNAIATATNNLESLGLLLANPEVLRQLQTLQQTMQQNSTNTVQHEMEEKMRKMQQMKQQEEEFDKHLAQTVQNLPFAAECELKPSDIMKTAPPPPPPPPPIPVGFAPVVMNPALLHMHPDMSQPPPGYHPPAMPFVSQPPPLMRQQPAAAMGVLPQQSPRVEENNANRRESSVEIVNCEQSRSQSRSPDRFRRRSRSRSPRMRGRERDRKSRSRTRSRSRSRRRRSRSRERTNDRQKRDDSRDRFRNEEDREKERERRKRGLPPLVKEKMSVCSTTLWVGHLSKLVHQEELSDTFGELGDIVSIDLISPRGCAFICMNRRQDAYRALTKLKNHKLQGKAITLAWAPGKGVKGKEWKDYWEVELGVSYIPWSKLNNVTDQDLDLLEEGGMIDEESMPPKLKGRRKTTSDSMSDSTQSTLIQGSSIPTVTDGVIQPPTSSAPMVDTSQPPPIRPQAPPPLLPPPNQLQMMPPGFSMPPGMLGPMGLQMPGLMPNVPIGVPPPNMQGLMPPGMMQQLMQSGVNPPFGAGVNVGLLTQIPMPAPAAPSDKSNATGMPHNVPPLGVPPPTSEPGMPNLPMMRQPYGMPPMPIPQQQPPLPQQQHPDDMDVEMEDVMCMPMKDHGSNNNNNKPSLSDQLLAAMKDNRNDNDRDFRDRDRDRERRDRERDRNDNDDRGRDRGRGRERAGRDRDRRNSRDNRDRDDRRGDRDREMGDRMGHRNSPMRQDELKKDSGPKQSLADRLRQLADGTLPLIEERIDRDMRGGPGPSNRSDRSMDRERNFPDEPRQAPPLPQQPPSLLGPGRRPGDGPPSLLDLPAPKFPPGGPDFPRDFGRDSRDLRDFPQRGPGSDRDGPRGFGPRGGRGPMDDFPEPPRSLMDRRFGSLDEFEAAARMGADFDLRDRDFEARGPPRDDFDRRPFDFDMRPPRDGPPFDLPRGMPDDFDIRDHPDFDPRRRDFFLDSKFGHPNMMGPRNLRGPPLMGPDNFSPRGARGLAGPPMFHGPRGMGPRGMRGNMRQPFNARGGGAGGGPPFDGPPFDGPPFDGPRDSDFFNRPGGPGGPPFEDGRSGRGPMPPFGGPGGPMPPPLLGDGPNPWSNGPPSLMMDPEGVPTAGPGSTASGNEKSDKRSGSSDREKRRENRKSRWGNVSPSAEQSEEGQQQPPSQEVTLSSENSGTELPSLMDGHARSTDDPPRKLPSLMDGLARGIDDPPRKLPSLMDGHARSMEDPPRESWNEPPAASWNEREQESGAQPMEQSSDDFEAAKDQGSLYDEGPAQQQERFESTQQREQHFETTQQQEEHSKFAQHREEHFESTHQREEPFELTHQREEHMEPPPPSHVHESCEEPPRNDLREEHFEPPRNDHRDEHFEPPRNDHRDEHFEPPRNDHRDEHYEPPHNDQREEHYEPPHNDQREEHFEPPPSHMQESYEEPARQEHYEEHPPPQQSYEPPPPQENYEIPQQEHYEEQAPPRDDFDVAPPEAQEVQKYTATPVEEALPTPQQDSESAPEAPTEES